MELAWLWLAHPVQRQRAELLRLAAWRAVGTGCDGAVARRGARGQRCGGTRRLGASRLAAGRAHGGQQGHMHCVPRSEKPAHPGRGWLLYTAANRAMARMVAGHDGHRADELLTTVCLVPAVTLLGRTSCVSSTATRACVAHVLVRQQGGAHHGHADWVCSCVAAKGRIGARGFVVPDRFLPARALVHARTQEFFF